MKNHWLAISGVSALALGAWVVACNGTTSDTTSPTTDDSGAVDSTTESSPPSFDDGAFPEASPSDAADAAQPGDAGDAGADGDSGALDAADAAPDAATDGGADAGAECGLIPTLHPGNGTTLFCPFGPDAGAPIDCVVGQDFCCISGKVGGVFPPSTCEPVANGQCAAMEAGVQGSTEVQCEDPATDCPAGSVCCGAPNTIAMVAGCGYDKLTGWVYTHCEQGTACMASEFTVCEAAGECGTGQSCVPFKAKGVQLGFCQ